MKKTDILAMITAAVAAIAVFTAFAKITPQTAWWEVSPTNTLADVAAGAGLATTGDVSAINKTKQDKLPYPTNAIPQGAVSGLSTALAGKLDNGGGTLYGSLYFSGEDHDKWDFLNLDNTGEFPGGMTIGYDTYSRCFLFRSYDASYNWITVILPADKEGTVAFMSDIKPIPVMWALANITNNYGGAVTAADVGAYPVASGVALANRVSAVGPASTNYTDAAIVAAIANTNPTFSNAVLSVGLNIDTNTVAAINALVEAGDDLPIGGAATVGGLLLALAAAVAALKRTKADASSLAPAFSSDSTVQYAVGSHCTYNGKLYKCTTATTGGTWVAGNWAEDTMTDPDAVLDITAQNRLRVVAKDGTPLWAQGYDLASASSATLACDAVNNFTFADGATSQAFALPAAPTSKVGDFVLDIDNSANTGAATMTFTGLDTTFSVVVPKGNSLNDMLAIAAGELAQFYVTLSTFRVNNLPTWHIAKQVVENGGATA